MHSMGLRLARLEARRLSVQTWSTPQGATRADLATPERTAAVAQILVDAGALRITAEGEVLTRTSGGGWRPYTIHPNI